MRVGSGSLGRKGFVEREGVPWKERGSLGEKGGKGYVGREGK